MECRGMDAPDEKRQWREEELSPTGKMSQVQACFQNKEQGGLGLLQLLRDSVQEIGEYHQGRNNYCEEEDLSPAGEMPCMQLWFQNENQSPHGYL